MILVTLLYLVIIFIGFIHQMIILFNAVSLIRNDMNVVMVIMMMAMVSSLLNLI